MDRTAFKRGDRVTFQDHSVLASRVGIPRRAIGVVEEAFAHFEFPHAMCLDINFGEHGMLWAAIADEFRTAPGGDKAPVKVVLEDRRTPETSRRRRWGRLTVPRFWQAALRRMAFCTGHIPLAR